MRTPLFKTQFAYALNNRIGIKINIVAEYFWVGQEVNRGAGFSGWAYLFQLARAFAALENAYVPCLPSRFTSATSQELTAFTQLTPTPCRPPDT